MAITVEEVARLFRLVEVSLLLEVYDEEREGGNEQNDDSDDDTGNGGRAQTARVIRGARAVLAAGGMVVGTDRAGGEESSVDPEVTPGFGLLVASSLESQHEVGHVCLILAFLKALHAWR